MLRFKDDVVLHRIDDLEKITIETNGRALVLHRIDDLESNDHI